MERGLILEAMDCVVIEIFEVYSQICTGIARFLVVVLGSQIYAGAAAAARQQIEVQQRRGCGC
jgi:hypothetical protein